MGLTFCILLLLSLANSGVYKLVWSCEHLRSCWWCEHWRSCWLVVYWCYWFVNVWRQIPWKYRCCSFQLLKNSFLSDSFKTSSVYYMLHDYYHVYYILFKIVSLWFLFRSKEYCPPRWVESLVIFFHEISRHVDDVNRWTVIYLAW